MTHSLRRVSGIGRHRKYRYESRIGQQAGRIGSRGIVDAAAMQIALPDLRLLMR